MKTVRIPSPARSQGTGPRTPIHHKHRRTLSVSSARSNASGRLTALIQQKRNVESFVVSPLASRKSILSDNTEIEEPRRKSWWKNLGENSRDVIELLEENKVAEPNNIIEELDIEILSQEKKNYTMDLPESSDSESINSIVIPQRKLFTQKENLPQKKFGQIIGARETLAKLHKPNTTNVDKTINVETRELFPNKQRSKPTFPAALLNISPNKTTADKTKEFATVEPKAQVRNIFGNRATKRKNIFTNFIVSESEDEIPEIQPKVFGFQKKIEARRRGSSSSRGIRESSPASSITTDIEMDDWKMLPSSTMVEHQLEIMMADGNSPKRTRLSKLTEIESEAGSYATKNSNKSTSSKETEKSRKSKTYIKEKAPNTSTTRNKSKTSQDEAEEIFGENEEVPNKSRKSKTFVKEKVPDYEVMSTKNSLSQNDNAEEMLGLNQSDQNKSSKDTEKTRKSKTFTKEIAPDLEASMTTRNETVISQNDEIFIENQINQNKSKPKIADINLSQSSIKTRSQIIYSEPNTENAENNKTQTHKSKSVIAISPKGKNIESEETPLVAADQENDDDELNFTLEYENDDQQSEDLHETIQNKSNTKTRGSKSITEKENSANVSKSNKTLPNKVIHESAELESTQEKSNRSLKDKKSQAKSATNVKDKIELNHKQADHPNDKSNNFDGNDKENEVEENEIDHELVENQNEDVDDKKYENISEQVDDNDDNRVENNDVSEQQIESEVEKSQEIEENDETNEIEEQNESQDIENASENEEEQSHEVQDQSQPENVSQELEDEVDNNESQAEDENEEEQNESEPEQNESEVEQNESEVEQNESEVEQNESEVEQNESGVEKNESQDVELENEDEDQNISQEADEQNESDVEQSEAIADSDNDNDEPDQSQDDAANDSDNQDTDVMENVQDNEVIESGPDENQETETPNVSHDTTGRNRKKNESPEVILHDSNDHLESFAVQGRNTSVRKSEMIKTLNIRPSLAPVRESTGFSDGRNSSAEGSGWDSHRTTRKTLRQTFGKDFTPRKSLRALVMEKSAKRQTQHNDIASITAKFPQANSTELPEMSNRYDNEVDQNQESNHEVSLRTRQTMLEEYLQKIKKKNTESRLKMEEAVRNSLNAPSKDHIFKVPAKPLFARRKPTAKPKQTKSTLFLGELPAEVIEDLKYKPPKRFQPSNAPWITKRLYKFLESKLEAKYDYKARVRAEKLVESIYRFAKDLRRHDVATTDAVDVLKREMARLDVVKTHFEFYEFFHQFMPREVRVKVVPDMVNKLSLPRHGVFSEIL